MRRPKVVACCLIVLLAGSRFASALPTVEELEKKLAEVEKTMKSFSGDAKMSGTEGQLAITATVSRVSLFVRDGDKILIKDRIAGDMTLRRPDGRELALETKRISDGATVWQEMRRAGTDRIQVIKKRADAKDDRGVASNQTPLEDFKTDREMYDLKVTGEETLDGEAVYVLEGTFQDAYLKKNPASAERGKTRHKIRRYYAKKDMLERNEIAHDTNGKLSYHLVVTNVKVNPEVDEKLFEYTPPPGAQVRDMTGE